jgi:hypothetical protein
MIDAMEGSDCGSGGVLNFSVGYGTRRFPSLCRQAVASTLNVLIHAHYLTSCCLTTCNEYSPAMQLPVLETSEASEAVSLACPGSYTYYVGKRNFSEL